MYVRPKYNVRDRLTKLNYLQFKISKYGKPIMISRNL